SGAARNQGRPHNGIARAIAIGPPALDACVERRSLAADVISSRCGSGPSTICHVRTGSQPFPRKKHTATSVLSFEIEGTMHVGRMLTNRRLRIRKGHS